MTGLVIMKDQQVVTSSINISESFNKQHAHVNRDIENLLNGDVSDFGEMFLETTEPDSYGRYRKVYYMNRDGFTLLAMGFTGKKAMEFKLKYIKEFNSMEKSIKSKTPISKTKLLLQASLEHEEKLEVLSEDVSMLKETMRIDGVQEFQIKREGNKKVLSSLGGYGTDAYNQLSKKAYARFWRDFKNYFTLPRYGELPKAKFEDAIEFIEEWTPDTEMRLLIKQANVQSKLGI